MPVDTGMGASLGDASIVLTTNLTELSAGLKSATGMIGKFTDGITSKLKGVGGKTLEKLRPWVTVTETATVPDTAPGSVERLERKPLTPPKPSDPPRGPKIQAGEPPLDLNAASEAELTRLPGVGPVLAQRIVLARGTERFKSPDDLRRVKGIGAKTLASVRPFVTVRGDSR